MAAGAAYYTYMVRCDDQSLYTGITTDVVRRLGEHLSQRQPGAKYTQSHLVVELVGLWRSPDRATASALEYRIKQLDKASKLRLVAYPERVYELMDGRIDLDGEDGEALVEPVDAAQRDAWWMQASSAQS